MKKVLISLLYLISSCKDDKIRYNNISLKDSALEVFTIVNRNDNKPYSNQFDKLLLKKINNNDTFFLREYIKKIKSSTEPNHSYRSNILEANLKIPPIEELDCDVGYCITQSFAFTKESNTVLLIRNDSSINLISYLYIPSSFDGSRDFRFLSKKEKKIDFKDWQKLTELIYECDYWALSPQNDISGFDGASWEVVGKRKIYDNFLEEEVIQTHYVYRWTPSRTAFLKMCEKMLDLGGVKYISF